MNYKRKAKNEVIGCFAALGCGSLWAAVFSFVFMFTCNNHGFVYYFFDVLFWIFIVSFWVTVPFYRVSWRKLAEEHKYKDYVNKGMKYLNRKG